VLALFYPWQGAGEQDAVVVFFSSNSLTENFAEGANLSFMVNDSGDYLIHADSDLILTGANALNSTFVKMMMESADQGRQTLYTDNDGNRYFGAYRKISLGNAAVITTIPYDVVFEGVTATTRRNIYLTGAVLFIAILFVWFFSKTVSVPLKTLASAAAQIESGDFELHLTQKSRDEIGYLTKSFQKMSGALSVFGRFTNRDIAVRAMRGEIKPGGLPRHATIFFSDIRGFTQMCENFTKEYNEEASNRIVLWLNDYLTRMVECVEKTNGVVDKFIGDAVMAHWGTAYTAGTPAKDAFNCINAALLMRTAVYLMNKDRKKEDVHNPPISIGCGINTGIVTTGQLGSEQRMEYTVIGDPVNLASRIESLNKPMGTDILMSENTWELIGEYFITEEMPSVTVKGKEKPVRIFAVVNQKNNKKGPQTLAQVRQLLGITPPDLSKVDTGAEEKKYKIGQENEAK
jgi:adenylate cyclase